MSLVFEQFLKVYLVIKTKGVATTRSVVSESVATMHEKHGIQVLILV